MDQIIRGTTPTITMRVNMDLSDYTCYLSIGRANRPYLNACTDKRITVSGGESYVAFKLTQSDTLSLPAGKQKMQLRAIKDDEAIATEMVDVEVVDVILNGAIEDVS